MNVKQKVRTRISEICIRLNGTNTVKDEKGDLLADCHSILTMWRHRLSQLLNVHWLTHIQQSH